MSLAPLIDRSVDRSIDWLFGYLFGWLVIVIDSYSVSHSVVVCLVD